MLQTALMVLLSTWVNYQETYSPEQDIKVLLRTIKTDIKSHKNTRTVAHYKKLILKPTKTIMHASHVTIKDNQKAREKLRAVLSHCLQNLDSRNYQRQESQLSDFLQTKIINDAQTGKKSKALLKNLDILHREVTTKI